MERSRFPAAQSARHGRNRAIQHRSCGKGGLSDGSLGGRCHGWAHWHGPAAGPRPAATRLGDGTRPRHRSSARGAVAGCPASCCHPSRWSLGVMPAGSTRPAQPRTGREPGSPRDPGPTAVPATSGPAQSLVGCCRSTWSAGVRQLLDTARHGGGSDHRSGTGLPSLGQLGSAACGLSRRIHNGLGCPAISRPACTMIFCPTGTLRVLR